MRLGTRLEDIGKSVAPCLRCNMCTYGEWPENVCVCPLYANKRTFTASAGGLMFIARALIENKMALGSDLFDLVYSCINCRACDDICQIVPFASPHLRPTDVVRLLRHELVRRGLLPNGPVREFYHMIKTNGNMAGPKFDIKIPEKMKNERAKNVLYIEGPYSDEQTRMYNTALQVLERLGLDVYVHREENGCGATLYDLGFFEELGSLLRTKAKIMNSMVGKNLIFIDPHVQEFVTKTYPGKPTKDKRLKGRHLIELVLDSLKGLKIGRGKREKVSVTYHDPCILGRGLGIYDPPRELLQSFAGVTLLEMERNRRNSYCCGAGDGMRGRAIPEYSSDVAEQRLEDFRHSGADLLITACPHCKEMLESVLPVKERVRIKDVIQFVSERIG